MISESDIRRGLPNLLFRLQEFLGARCLLWAGIRSEVLSLLVGVRGFEPPAPASRKQCSTRLSYTPPTGRRL